MNVPEEESFDTNVDIPCWQCGEMVRKGSVRCRECGSFLDPDAQIAAHEAARQSNIDNDVATMGGGDDDDFEVGPGVTTFSAGESAFDLGSDATDDAVANELAIDDDPLVEEDPFDEENEQWDGSSDDSSQDTSPTPSVEADSETPSSKAPVSQTGDALLDGALEEESESRPRGSKRTVKASDVDAGTDAIVYCPSGHRIHVEDRFRGRMGRCPQCRAPFLVPGIPSVESLRQHWGETEKDDEDDEAILVLREDSGRYGVWMPDIRMHRVTVSKIKMKEGSLADESETVDIGFADDAILIVTMFKGKGGLTSRTAQRKKPDVRNSVMEHLQLTKKKADPGKIPAPFFYRMKPEQYDRIWIAQPAPPRGESLFADLDLFGKGVIALRLPSVESSKERLYITMTLSQYRELVKLLAEKYELVLASEEHSIPLIDSFEEEACHYTDQKMPSLKSVEFYEFDPLLEVELIGYKCQTCGIAVSARAREREKLGGKNAAGIAKAKCPSCSQKFGSQSLYGIKEPESSQSESAAEPAVEADA